MSSQTYIHVLCTVTNCLQPFPDQATSNPQQVFASAGCRTRVFCTPAVRAASRCGPCRRTVRHERIAGRNSFDHEHRPRKSNAETTVVQERCPTKEKNDKKETTEPTTRRGVDKQAIHRTTELPASCTCHLTNQTSKP